MKISPILFGLLFPVVASARAEAPSLTFPAGRIESLPRTLLEGTMDVLPASAPKPSPVMTPSFLARGESHSRVVSKMPILAPGPASPKMPVLLPDESVDFKLLIKRPDVESVK